MYRCSTRMHTSSDNFEKLCAFIDYIRYSVYQIFLNLQTVYTNIFIYFTIFNLTFKVYLAG